MLRHFTTILFACCCSAAEPILTIQEPHSSGTTFALYDDGSIIWRSDKPNHEEPFCRQTTPNASTTLKEIIPYDLTRLADYYELTQWMDSVRTIIWTPKKTLHVYGDWRRVPPTPAQAFSGDRKREMTELEKKELDYHRDFDEAEKKLRNSLPSEIRTTLLQIDELRKQAGKRWLPDRVEVTLWPYEYAPEESIVWPQKWPGLTSPTTAKRAWNRYSVFVPSEELAALRGFLATQRERGAVLIDGRKISMAILFPLPKEELWMRK